MLEVPMSHHHTRRAAALGVAALLLLTACGDDDEDAGVAADAASAEPRPCAPVGEDLEAEAVEVVEVALDEYSFSPTPLAVPAGVVTFAAENVGEEEHELAFLPGGGGVPEDEEGLPDEDALAEANAFELEAFGPDQVCNATYDLEAGDYTLFCIVRAEDGTTHLSKGMRGVLTVG
jgi:plastocyanin